MIWRTGRVYQYLVSMIVVLAMMLAHNSTFSFDVPLMLTGIALLATLLISIKRRGSDSLISPLDFGWLPFVLLTGISVALAPFPRRSVEIWLWVTAIQLPIAYGALYLFRHHLPERALYRALLVVGGYLYLLAFQLTLRYVSDLLAARADGMILPGFRLFGILNHPNIFAMFIAVAMPCILSYLFLKMARIERWGAILWMMGGALALFGTGSRSGLIATTFGLLVALSLTLIAHPAPWMARFRAWAAMNRSRAVLLVGTGGVLVVIVFSAAVALQFGRPQQDDGGGRLSFYQNALKLFLAHPLAGGGPGGFVQNEIALHSVPPYKPLSHAHNILLTTAAESGVLGLLGFCALVVVAIWVCVMAWRKQPERRPLIAGPIGALVAFTAFGILDSPISQIGPFSLATLLLAFISAGMPVVPQPTALWRTRLIQVSVGGVALLCALIAVPYSIHWTVTSREKDNIEEWTDAAQQMDSLHVFDKTDGLVLLQSAYDWAQAAALSDYQPQSQALNNAIDRFRRAIRYDPNLGMHYLNLSMLYFRAGRTTEAWYMAQQAAERTDGDPVTWLNFGIVLETIGADQEAVLVYSHALQLEPRWSLAQFWETSPIRLVARTQSKADNSRSLQYVDFIAVGNRARAADRNSEALESYDKALKIASGLSATAYVKGLIALAQDDASSARKWMLQAAISSTADQSYIAADAWLVLGDLARDQGDREGMLQRYRDAYRYLTSRGIGGYGTKGDWNYALLCFHRFGLISDYLPGVVMLDISPEQATRFKVLARANALSGDMPGAVQIYRQILQSNPNDTEAKLALARLMRE